MCANEMAISSYYPAGQILYEKNNLDLPVALEESLISATFKNNKTFDQLQYYNFFFHVKSCTFAIIVLTKYRNVSDCELCFAQKMSSQTVLKLRLQIYTADRECTLKVDPVFTNPCIDQSERLSVDTGQLISFYNIL